MKQALQIDSPERSFVTFLQNLVAQDGIISTVFVNATMAKESIRSFTNNHLKLKISLEAKNKDDNHRLTIRILSRNHFRFQWLAGEASRVLSTHPELVVGALVELGGYSLRILAEASHLGPVVIVALRLLDDVVEDVATSVVFGCLPCQRALVSKDIRDLDRSAWGTWAIWNRKEDKLK